MDQGKMDSEPNRRTKQTRRRQRWGFTFIGGTPEKPGEQRNKVKSFPESIQNKLMRKQVFPLSTTQVGDRVVITQILSGQNMAHRLSQMGLTKGSEVQVISKTTSGSVIICIQDEQIGLGAGMANQVMVTMAAEE